MGRLGKSAPEMSPRAGVDRGGGWDCEGAGDSGRWVDRVSWPLLSFPAASFFQRTRSYSSRKAHSGGPHRLGTWLGKPSSLPVWCQHPRPYRPTSSSSRSPARGRSRLQMSMVKSVLLLLKMEVSDDMSAAIITAIIRPRRPAVRDAAGLPASPAGAPPAVTPPAVAPPAVASGVRPPQALPAGQALEGGEKPQEEAECEGRSPPHRSLLVSTEPRSGQRPPGHPAMEA